MRIPFAMLVALPLLAAPAKAEPAAAQACAAKLSKDAKAIYDSALPELTPSTNLRDLLTEKTRGLAVAGTISRWNARDSATAASTCLQQARG